MAKEALDSLRTTEPVEYLAPSADLARLARAVSSHLYSSLVPFCPTKPPLDQLLADESFDAEQIWSQIELLSKPLLPALRRCLSRFEKEPGSKAAVPRPAPEINGKAKEDDEREENDSDEMDLGDEEEGDEDEEDEEEEEEDEDKDEEVGEDEKGEGEGEAKKGVEDKFLKIKELEKFLEDGEAEEYGLPTQKNKIDLDDRANDNESDQDREADDDDDEEDGFGVITPTNASSLIYFLILSFPYLTKIVIVTKP